MEFKIGDIVLSNTVKGPAYACDDITPYRVTAVQPMASEPWIRIEGSGYEGFYNSRWFNLANTENTLNLPDWF